MNKIDIIDLMIEWGQKTPGLRARSASDTFVPTSRIVQFYTGEGYNNYRRVGIWLASCTHDMRIWGPTSFGQAGGFTLKMDGTQSTNAEGGRVFDYHMKPWLSPADPLFFEKLRKVLFRFNKKEKKP
jgi:hypothetical protein